jgi:ATP-dependent Clp protease ATP-binding subunit ClpC
MSGYNFSNRVRKVLQLAREQASDLGDRHVGPEHLLLGILREGEGVAAAILRDLRVDLEDFRNQFRGSLDSQSRPESASLDLPYTSSAKKVLELAMGEARQLGYAYVGTEHLLLGLLHPQSTPAVSALAAAGVTIDHARVVCQRLQPATPGDHPAIPQALGRPTSSDAVASRALMLALIALLVALAALVLALRAGRSG